MQRPSALQRFAAVAALGVLGLGIAWSMGEIIPGGVRQALAQNRPPLAPAAAALAQVDEELVLDGVFLPPDRTAKRRLEMSQTMISEGRYGEAVRLLGSLLENSEDFFYKPDPAQPVYRSLKAEAGRLIATLPAAGRQSYELQYGQRARQLLQQATERGSADELAEVARQFFFTEAGEDATYLLGRRHLDQNRPMAAALCFERLLQSPAARERLDPSLSLSLASCWLRAGKVDRATSALLRLKRARPGTEVVVAGTPTKLFGDDAQAAAWMQDVLGPVEAVGGLLGQAWTLFRGDEGRNAASSGSQPLLDLRWRQRTSDDGQVEKFVGKLRQDYISQEIVALPSFHPLAVDDVVIMRTAFALQAVDFETGKLVWKYPSADDSLEQFLRVGSNPQPGRGVQVLSGLDQRLWEDAVYGTLSSDGSNVYFVDDLGLGVSASPLRTVLPNGRRARVGPQNVNSLAARELRTQGKLKWEVGGANGGDEPKLAGAFFLSPPLPLLGSLYAMAEFKEQELRLVALSAENGSLLWSQQLAVVDPPVTQDSDRRNAGATPSYADGVLVCPTSAGAVVAIDLTTRSLLWGYQYPKFQQGPTDRLNAARFGFYAGSERRANEHWVDGTVTIADGRVIITPVESDQMYCLDLETGKELWKQNRDDYLYVACVHDGRVILVGRKGVGARNLSDGETAWPDLELTGESMPSGRGFYSGNDYFLPLTTAEVARIDLRTGRLVERARSRSGAIPGNLICFRDAIISQGADAVDAYYQLEPLKQRVAAELKARPDDPKALAALAVVKLDQQLLPEAIDLYRRAYAARPDDTLRQQLVDTMLEGLRVDFAAHRGSIAELERLIESRDHRLTFLRALGAGQQAAGEVLPAFETYLRLVDEGDLGALDTVDAELSVQRGRWVAAQLAALRASASEADRKHIDERVDARLKTALAADSGETLRQFVSVFGSLPAVTAARAALVMRLKADELLEADSLRRQLETSGAQAEAAAATAHLAKVADELGRADVAAVYYRQLAERYATVDCAAGKTGQQIIDELAADSPVRQALSPSPAWPAGRAHDRESTMSGRPTNAGRPRSVELDVLGSRAPFFPDLTVALDLQSPVLIGQDGLGQKRFRVAIYEDRAAPMSRSRFNMYNAPPLSYVTIHGGLLVLSMSNQVMAIDGLCGARQSSSRVLWSSDLGDKVGGLATSQGIYARPVPVAWGGTRFVPEDTFGRRYSTIGPVTDQGVYFQRLRELHCVDPLTGKTIWSRKNVGLGNQLFGDAELLFVAPPGDGETLVLRASTGEKVDVRRIVPFEKRMLTVGRQVMAWNQQGPRQVLEMHDPWAEKTLWSHTFKSGAKASLLSEEAVAVFEPSGAFSLITVADGKQLVKEQLEPEKSLVGIHLLDGGANYLLLTNTTERLEPEANVRPIAGAANYPIVNGRVYAFDKKTGAKAWAAPTVVPQHGMATSQPSQVPLLVFVRQYQPTRGPAREPRTGLLCLDKRSGRVVYQNEQLPPTLIGNLEVSGDPAKHTVTLTLPPKVIELTMTDEPVEAAPAQPKEAKP